MMNAIKNPQNWKYDLIASTRKPVMKTTKRTLRKETLFLKRETAKYNGKAENANITNLMIHDIIVASVIAIELGNAF